MCGVRQVQDFFLALIRAGLWGKPIASPYDRPWPAKDWELLFKLSQRHALQAVVYDGIQHLQTAHFPPKPLLLKWLVLTDRIESANRRMNAFIAKQHAYFCQHHIFPVLLKGQGIAQYYPERLHRTSGDVDWYFESKSEFIAARKLIKNLGISVNKQAGCSEHYYWGAMEVEHHRRAIDLHSPFIAKAIKQPLVSTLTDAPTLSLEGQEIRTLPIALNLLQVNAHILKHLLSYGIGLRQLCDSAILYRTYAGKYDVEQLTASYRRAGIHHWVDRLHYILESFLGLEGQYLPSYQASGKDAAPMLEDIIGSGEFGFFDRKFTTVSDAGLKRIRKSKRVMGSFLRYGKLAPMEALSFPVFQLVSRVI